MLSSRIQVERVPAIRETSTCLEIDELFRANRTLSCLVVTDDQARPTGLVDRTDFHIRLSQRYGRALYEGRPVSKVMTPDPVIVGEQEDFDEFVRRQLLDTRRNLSDSFVLVDEAGRYRSVSSGRAVLSAYVDIQADLLDELSSSRELLISANQQLEREITIRRRAEQQALMASQIDELTGLFNRRPFVQRVGEMIDHETAFHIIFVDLDGFKQVNDVYGHLAGDEALKVMARRMKAAHEHATVARFGGDEMALLLPANQCAGDFADLAHALHDKLVKPFTFDGSTLTVGASVGVANHPEDGRTQADLLQAADMAMLRAKREGGGVRLYDCEVDAGDMESRNQTRRLSQAIEAREIVPHFQPIYCAQTGEVRLYEALARWPAMSEPLSKPGHFIQIAEREGLISDLFWLIFERATDAIIAQGLGHRLSLNVSPRQFGDPGFAQRLIEATTAQGLKPEDLELEVTETAMIYDLEAAEAALQRFSRAGMKIALDDFGTGYSSLSLLHRLPISKIKIDQSFVRRMSRDARSRDIIESTILMAGKLGLEVCAEGVEDAATLGMLKRAGCDLMQGFHLCRPGPTLDIAEIGGSAAA